MVVESEVLKVQNCALFKLSLPMHSNDFSPQSKYQKLWIWSNLTIATIEFHFRKKKFKINSAAFFSNIFQIDPPLSHFFNIL